MTSNADTTTTSNSPETPDAGSLAPQPGSPQQTDATTASEEQPAGAPTGTASGAAAGDQPGGQAAEKPTSQWATGDEPMTGPQASYLSTLAREAGEQAPEGLTKAQASDEIERLQGKSDRVDG